MSTIQITYEGNKFTLEYTRRTVRMMEQDGFEIDKVQSMPMTMITKLFSGAFLAHHPRINQELVEDMFGDIEDKPGLVNALSEMYMKTYEYLLDDTAGNKKGNASWAKA